MHAVDKIPQGRHAVSPVLAVHNAAAAIEFYKTAFGATELFRLALPDGRIGHIEFQMGDSLLMMSDEFPEDGGKSPRTLGGSSVALHFYVEDVDAVFHRAIQAGAKIIKPVRDHFSGDRAGLVEDPFGHSWWIATHTEDVSPQEMQKRAQALFEKNEM